MLSKMIGNILMGCLTIYLVVACSGIMNIKSVTKILIKWFHQPGIFWEYSDGHCIWWRSPILATAVRYLVTEKITTVANRDSGNGRQKGKNDLWLQVFLKLAPSRAKQTIYFGTHLAQPAIGSWWWWWIWWGWQWEWWGCSSFSMMILQMVIEKGVSIPRGSWPHQQSARIIISSNIATLALFFSY